jgi:hypothetical protein
MKQMLPVSLIMVFSTLFIALAKADESDLEWSTLLGGTEYDQGYAIAVDNSGNAFVTGVTQSADFPTTAGAFDETDNRNGDVFMARLILIGTAPVPKVPKTPGLHQNYPNPFNASTEIRYHIPVDGHVSLKIYNTLGQQVRTLMDSVQPAGKHITDWDGQDERAQEVASGLYFCRLQAGDFTKTIKMVLVK